MIKKFGVRVKLMDSDGSLGYIIKRIDASAYEIFTDDERLLVLAPEQFKEINDEEEN